jgi:Holliday junction resolvasome RuvABC endonuclease subunit
MVILGIDLGTVITGITTITGEKESPQFKVEVIKSAHKRVEERLLEIIPKIEELIEQAGSPIDLIVCEYPFNIKGNARILVEMYGIIHYYCLSAGYPFLLLPQTKIKKYVTGSGKAEKSDMRMQVYKEFGLDLSEDAADSFWIAHMGMTYMFGTDKKFRQESIDALKNKKK